MKTGGNTGGCGRAETETKEKQKGHGGEQRSKNIEAL